MTVEQYIENINAAFKRGNATEHTYRSDLKQLIESLVPGIAATNEPKRQLCGAPDYILTKKDIPIGFIEAKDVGDKDLEGAKKTGNKEQFDRYKASLNNLIFTDYLDFHLYRDGQFITKIAIAEIQNDSIVSLSANFSSFENLLKDFCIHIGQSIKSSKKLAEMMAGKARLLSEVIEKALTSDEDKHEDSTLKDQMNAFKQILIHDITPKRFADVYAQTIAYGMFAARLHDATLPTFSRQEAAELIPKSNPFLRKLFGYIAGPEIDDRIKWIVDSLVEIFLACNVEEILKNYGKATKMEDPIIHFYETFLSEYDKTTKIQLGVWYTPQPVVDFIVRAVDDVLKSEFSLANGLADNSKIKIKINLQETDKRYKESIKTVEEEVHRVQILDPATGTGTFLAEVVKHIYKKFSSQQGNWSNYVESHLLPRLNGFEILMASYAMAHLKLDLLLTETGYKPTKEQRFRVYLTDSLEEHHQDTGTLFTNWLSSEANEANYIKRDTPVMCIIGNPPYLGESKNKGKWILKLMEDYKKEPGGIEKLKEKNSKWINSDEYKFIRYGQHYIEKNGSGVLAFINPHSFLDNPTFRGMRWNLLKTYDKIYTIDLHGNSIKKEVSPDGTVDANVFDIQQGVSINIFIKTGKKKANTLGKVFHYDLYGKREYKYNFLLNNSLNTIPYKELPNEAPNYFFMQKDFGESIQYNHGFDIKQLFELNGVGICSKRDKIAFQENKKDLINVLNDFKLLSEEELKLKYSVKKESRDQKVSLAKQNIIEFGIKDEYITKINYRPFDIKWTYHTNKVRGFLAYPVYNVMKHFLDKPNYGLITNRQCQTEQYQHAFITNIMNDLHITETANANPYTFPLYVYNDNSGQQTIEETEIRKPNLNKKIIKQISEKLILTFTSEKETKKGTFAPIDILDYIYAVLHSPTYREKYKEFLKIDFPRVPYPKDEATFWKLVKLGGEIREIHLLESATVEKYITKYPIDGSNIVGKISFVPNGAAQETKKKSTKTESTNSESIHNPDTTSFPQPHLLNNEDQQLHEPSVAYKGEVKGKVYINDTQYFDNVPEVAWNFYIGGYQPAQKWLKDRKEKKLEFDDILHYQKIIVALSETDRIMKEIDKIEIEA